MKFSQAAWKASEGLITAIHAHPFNVELGLGTLSRERFGYYIEQDVAYLNAFARCHAMVTSRMTNPEHIKAFLRYCEFCFFVEQELVHQNFTNKFDLKKTGKSTPATLNYCNFLLKTSAYDSVEVAVASVLPCFWVYREVGLAIAAKSKPDNPYDAWIQTYSSPDFIQTVSEAIGIADELAESASPQVRKQMIDAFYMATCLEWHFWNDSYNLSDINQLTLAS